MKVFICGPARHGKDTVAAILKERYGLTHESSSHFCMKVFLRQALAGKYGLVYESDDACFEDRHYHRKKWYDLIYEYNRSNNGRPGKLARELFAVYDIYVGIRDREEYLDARDASDLAIWVDAFPRLDVTGAEAAFADNLVRASDCDVTIWNDKTVEELERKVCRLFRNFPVRLPAPPLPNLEK